MRVISTLCLSLFVLASNTDAGPLRVYILAGQSNMQGHAHVQTFDAMRLNPATAPLLEQMRGDDGEPTVCKRVWISSIGSSSEEKFGKLTAGYGPEGRGPKIGPEFTFGLRMEQLDDGPVLIIKTAWGGKSLHTDFRPPSAEPFEFSAAQLERFEKQGKDVDEIKAAKVEATGHYYRRMLDHVRTVLSDIKRVVPSYDEQAGYELSGFVWFQGWNDMVDSGVYPDRGQPGGYDEYSRLFEVFIKDVRRDLGSPDLPFVIGVLGVNGPTEEYAPDQQRYKAVHQNFRDAMAAPAASPELKGTVSAVLTEAFWDQEVVRLRRREKVIKPEIDAIKAQMKSGDLKRDAGQVAIDALYEKTFNEREREILLESTSNADFHYMGSAGIMAQIGAAFADAIVELERGAPGGARL